MRELSKYRYLSLVPPVGPCIDRKPLRGLGMRNEERGDILTLVMNHESYPDVGNSYVLKHMAHADYPDVGSLKC
jgi:hypothetical protein